MKALAITLALVLFAIPANAGSSTNTWNDIGHYRAVDGLACLVYAINAPNYVPKCGSVASSQTSNTNAYAAECMFVFPFNGNKTVWRIDGSYDSNQHYTGIISQKSPGCTGYLCSIVGVVSWDGRSPLPGNGTGVARYSYSWTNGYGATCDVQRLPGSGQLAGDFYGNLAP